MMLMPKTSGTKNSDAVGALHLLEQLDDARLRAQRQGDEHFADAVLADVLGHVPQPAQALLAGDLVNPVVGAVVEVADEVDAWSSLSDSARATFNAQRARSTTTAERRASGSAA
jgi:hypothetical protein